MAAVGEQMPPPAAPRGDFRHEALLYGGEAEFLDGVGAFVEEGLAAGDPVLVLLGAPKIGQLQRRLGPMASRVAFADMDELGRNPARLLPVWREYVTDHEPGRSVRGVSEAIWAGRGSDELVEAQHHEALLNVAFDDTPTLALLCAYDLDALPPAVIDEARRTHPMVQQGGRVARSHSYLQLPRRAKPLSGPLAEPPGEPSVVVFGADGLPEVRELVERQAARVGLGPQRIADLVLAVDEVASNSIRHGGGGGTLRVWDDGQAEICEIRDTGTIRDAMVGRERPRPFARSGRGLWLAHQLCDLVELRSSPAGTVVRLAVRYAG